MADQKPRQMRPPVKRTEAPEAKNAIYSMFEDAAKAVGKAIGHAGQDKGNYKDVDDLYKKANKRGKMPGQ